MSRFMAALTAAAGLVTGCAGTAAQQPARPTGADEVMEGARETDGTPAGSTGRAAGAPSPTGERLEVGAGGEDI